MGWINDSLTEKGAHALAVKIREYWFKRGVPVTVWAESGRMSEDGGRNNGPAFWVVRSNINVGFRNPDAETSVERF